MSSSITELILDSTSLLNYAVDTMKADSILSSSVNNNIKIFNGLQIEDINVLEQDVVLPAIRVIYLGSGYGNSPSSVRLGRIGIYCIVEDVLEIDSPALLIRTMIWNVIKTLVHTITENALFTIESDRIIKLNNPLLLCMEARFKIEDY